MKVCCSVAVALILLAACGDEGGSAATSTSAPTSRSAPTSTSTPTSTSAPTTATTAGRLTESSQVTFDGVGPVRVGMTPEEASKAAGIKLVAEEGGEPECSYALPEKGSGLEEQLAFMVTKGMIARVDVTGGRIATAAGVRIGSTESEVKAAYPGAKESPHTYTDGHYLTVTSPKDANLRIVFETDGSRVVQYRAGRLPEVEYVEGCS